MKNKVVVWNGYTIILNWFWNVELSNNARIIYISGVSFRGYNGFTTKQLMERAQIKHRQTFINAIKELTEKGLVYIKYSKSKGCIKINHYEFIEDPKEWNTYKRANEINKEEKERYNQIMNGLKEKWSKK